MTKESFLNPILAGPTSNYAWRGVFENLVHTADVSDALLSNFSGQYLTPARRLIKDQMRSQSIDYFSEPSVSHRFGKPLEESGLRRLRNKSSDNEVGWPMETFLADLFPSYPFDQDLHAALSDRHHELADVFWSEKRGSDMLKEAFIPFHRKMAEQFYTQYILTYDEKDSKFNIGNEDIGDDLEKVHKSRAIGMKLLLCLYSKKNTPVGREVIESDVFKINNLIPSAEVDKEINRAVWELGSILRDHRANYYIKSSDDGLSFSLMENEDEGAIQPHFARLTGSDGLGCFLDNHYKRIGRALDITGELHDNDESSEYDQLPPLVRSDILPPYSLESAIWEYKADHIQNIVSKGERDIDIAYVPPQNLTDPDFIKNCWNSCRQFENGYEEDEIEIGSHSRKRYRGTNYEVVEIPLGEPGGSVVYRGWKLISSHTDDDTPIFILKAGTFMPGPNGFNPLKENSLDLVQSEFSIDITSVPNLLDYSDRRNDAVSIADRQLWLPMKSMSKKDMDLVISLPFTWPYDTLRYGRFKLDLIHSAEFFVHKPSIIEKTTRALKHMALRVGLFDLNQTVAEFGEKEIKSELWDHLNVATWRDYLFYTFCASAHLSPFVLAANLIPNSKLALLSDNLKEKLAYHGIDYTLSFGQLWPEIFRNMSADQIEIFLNAIPDQNTYLANYYRDPDKLENQGLFHLISALKVAGVRIDDRPIPEFDGNILLQTQYVFRHPDENEPLCLAQINQLYQDLSEPGYENISPWTKYLTVKNTHRYLTGLGFSDLEIIEQIIQRMEDMESALSETR